jgi:signal transduction histidine kinase
MFIAGIHAALQSTGPGAEATLTLNTWGVLALALLLLGAGAGWVFLVLSRRGSFPGRPEPSREPAAPRDPLEVAFGAAEAGMADAVFLCRDRLIVRAWGKPDLIGDDPGVMHGQTVTSVVAAEDLLTVSEAVHSLEGGASARREIAFGFRAPEGGGERQVACRFVRPVGVSPGDFVAVLYDVTRAAAVARAATDVASRVADALAQVSEAVIVTAGEGGRERITLANPAAASILGIPRRSLSGLSLSEVKRRAAASLPEEALERLFEPAGEPRRERIEVHSKNPRHFERSVRPLREGDATGGRLLVFRDTTRDQTRETELRRAAREAELASATLEERQEQILMANEGLERRISDFARFNRELRAIDEMKSSFLANVSHELQTPLVSIKGYTEMILKGRMGPLTAEQEKGLNVALRNVDRLIGLIDSLLSFVRTEKASEPLKIEVFSLKRLMGEVLELLKERAEERGVSVKVQFPSEDLSIRADRNRIAQVLINLVGNAVKYNRRGGQVEVKASRGSRSMARVEIRDTGVGIARDELDRIFERFFRADAVEGEGSGLGLAITRDILRLHGCKIRADSEKGKGSVFSFTLPLDPKGKTGRSSRFGGGDRSEG